jgi:hypothetical protein
LTFHVGTISVSLHKSSLSVLALKLPTTIFASCAGILWYIWLSLS